MKAKDVLHLDTKYNRNTSIDKLRSNFNNSQKLSTDNFVNHFEPVRNWQIRWTPLVQDFLKKLKPKCIQIIDLLFLKGIHNKKLQMN
jgi:RNA polymerase sigma-70 factor (ECF subfamily)